MSTTKPGQIRCPTCLRSTPPAAFCTQCGSPIPASALVRPRGMDRDELEERVRGRRPGDAGFRRGAPVEDGSEAGAYLPFEPEPEDALAARQAGPPGDARQMDNTPPDFDAEPATPPAWAPPAEPAPEAYRQRGPVPPPPVPAYAPSDYVPPDDAPRDYPAGEYEPDDAEPDYETAEPYPYTYPQRGDRGGRGGGALPVIGFVALCALALAVGAVLAGMFGDPDGVGQATPTPTASAPSATPQLTPSEAAASATPGTSATPEPTDGPITFADGAVITVQPCATVEMSFDGCDRDGSVVNGDRMWVWIGFDHALGSDTFVLDLRTANETIDQQEKVLGEILDCPNRCGGYLIGAAYRDLVPGEYVLVVRRNGDFADSATFRVER